MTLHAALLVVSACALLTPCWRDAGAQDLESLEIDGFINPVEFETGDSTGGAGHLTFLVSTVYGGVDHKYQFRNAYAGANVAFLKVSTSCYYDLLGAPLQTDFKLTGFSSANRTTTPDVRGRLRQSFYIPYSSERFGDQAFRLDLSWDVEKSGQHSYVHSYSIGVYDGILLPATDIYAVGGFLYAWTPSRESHYFAGAARVPLIRFPNGSSIRLGAGFAMQGTDFLDTITKSFASVNGELALDLWLPVLDAFVHVAYLPSFRFNDREANHEVSVFLGVPLLSTIF